MDINAFFQQELFNILEHSFTVGHITALVLFLITMGVAYWVILKRLMPAYFSREKVRTENQGRVLQIIRYIFYLMVLIGGVWTLGFDYVLYETINVTIRITTLLQALLILQLARLMDWIISKVLIYNYYRSRFPEESDLEQKIAENKLESRASRNVQYTVYVLAIILILQSFELDYTLVPFQNYDFKISNIFIAILIFLIAQLLAWILTQLILYSYYKRQEVDQGSRYAVNQLLTYVIYVMATFMAMDSVGIKMTVIWGGAAALLVGVGLGLQQTFNDLFSGIILLFERSVEVGDIVEINGLIGTVRSINLRTSLVETRAGVAVIVPNSKLITDNVINWSHADDKIRFFLGVGVAYGSDTALVKKLLLLVAKDNQLVLSYPAPIVRFTNFGDSSLDFELHFWSKNYIIIEDIKSDLRFEIDRAFRENDIVIPFPQRDVWLRK
ncbi:MAG: mechanosensitive ion channel domain-containing protein [Bacteroidota bacterium]